MTNPRRFDHIVVKRLDVIDALVSGSMFVRDMPVYGTLAERNVYFVDGVNGNDNFGGLDQNEPLATIAAAIALANARIDWGASPWAKRDVIFIAPGTYAENLEALAHGVVFIGIGHDIRDAQLGVKIKPAAGSPVVVGAIVNSAFHNIGFETGDGEAGSFAFDGGIVNNCLFENCLFTGPAESVTIGAAFRACDTVKSSWLNCWFCNANVGLYFNYADGGDSASYVLVEDGIISGCDVAGIYTHVNLVGPHSIIRRTNIFGGGVTLAKGVDDNAGILELSDLRITATDPVEGCRAANGCYGNGTLLSGSGE